MSIDCHGVRLDQEIPNDVIVLNKLYEAASKDRSSFDRGTIGFCFINQLFVGYVIYEV